MNKRKKGRSLARTKDQREALLRTLFVSLIEYQKIQTTLAKAKELRPFAEKMLTHAKTALEPEKKLSKIRLLSSKIPDESAGKLIKLAENMKARVGGYVRIIRLPDRKSDSSKMAIVEWVDKLEKKEEKKADKKKEAKPEKKEDKK